jgi:ATP-dependent phosphofructokinase / diphosphate-dependent phosphofructokinase
MANTPNGKLALLVGGGPAPGINGVISSVTIEACNHDMEVIGFYDGYKYAVLEPDKFDPEKHIRSLTINDVSRLHLNGGSILGTSRTNPAKNPADLERVLATFRRLGVTMLVSIGGDDTAFSASQVHLKAGGAIKVAHVPKTIDNDLPLPGSAPTFGFETARHYGVFIVRCLAEDARTTGRWYLIVSMGRAAGHLALGIGKAAAATLTLIPEEFRGRAKRLTLDELCDIIVGSMLKRKLKGRSYGMVVLAEGLLESIGEQGLLDVMMASGVMQYGTMDRDPHGHLRLGEIEFGRMVKDRLAAKVAEVGLKGPIIDKDLGYELRCADPIPFDLEYTRDLGYGAVKFLRSTDATKYGAVISLSEGKMKPLPFESIINPETGRMRPRLVDVTGEGFECAKRYMFRLDRSDFEAPKLSELAQCAGMTPETFKARFGYLVGL